MFGSELRAARLTKGIRLTDMAQRLGVSKGHISGIETNKKFPTQKLIRRYSEILEQTFSQETASDFLHHPLLRRDLCSAITAFQKTLQEEERHIETMIDHFCHEERYGAALEELLHMRTEVAQRSHAFREFLTFLAKESFL